MKRTYSHIDMDERRKIARWRTAGLTVDIIGEKLGRHRSTIFREIRRNMFIDDAVPNLNGYYCVTAHDMARERRTKLRKLMRFSHVRQSVIDRIMHGWSPQQIAGRMRLERHPISVSHETIYKFAYSSDGQAIKLWRHLPEHRARRRPRHARRKHGQRFSPELNILRRPDVVADRKQFGHWECDLIQFRKKFGKANVTSLVERVSRFAIFLRNNDRQSRPVMNGLVQALQTCPTSPVVPSRSTVARSSPTGLTYRQALAPRPGSATLNRRGKKEPSKIPTGGYGNGFRERSIPYR